MSTTPRQARGKRRTVQEKRTVKAWAVIDESGAVLNDCYGARCVHKSRGRAWQYARNYRPEFRAVPCEISYTLPRRKGAK